MDEAPLYRNRYRIPSARLVGHDYRAGWYFVTICTRDKIPFFGCIRSAAMEFSDIGESACKYWRAIPEHHSHVEIDEWTVMPNHIHGIIAINQPLPDPSGVCEDATRYIASLQNAGNQFGALPRGSLQAVIQSYKAAVTRWCRAYDYGHFAWQPRFHDHIIRSEISLNAIRAYIRDNPTNWRNDTEYHL